MLAPPPFDTLLYTPCPESWQGGEPGCAPPWQRESGLLPVQGVHMLLRVANLPEQELRHMGWHPHELSATPPPRWFREDTVAELLGRIVLDHDEVKWRGGKAQRAEASKLGSQVINTYFQ